MQYAEQAPCPCHPPLPCPCLVLLGRSVLIQTLRTRAGAFQWSNTKRLMFVL